MLLQWSCVIVGLPDTRLIQDARFGFVSMLAWIGA
jgi:hypothetical protein